MAFFKKSPVKKGLERAKEMGLITEEEFLKLTSDRADEKYRGYLIKLKKKK